MFQPQDFENRLWRLFIKSHIFKKYVEKAADQYIKFLKGVAIEKIPPSYEEGFQVEVDKYFPNEYNKFINARLPHRSVDSAVEVRLFSIAKEANKLAKIVTPWTIEEAKKIDVTELFGPSEKTLRILVLYRDKSYIYELTEAFMFGLLIVIHSFDEFKFYLADIFESTEEFKRTFNVENTLITASDLMDNYTTSNSSKYTANTEIGNIYFDTIDVIQGIITSAMWINESPHKYIKDIYRDGILVTF